MNVAPSVLFQAQFASDSAVTVFTCPAGKTTIIDKLTGMNTDSGSQTLTVYLVKSTNSVQAFNAVVKAIAIAAGVLKDFTELQNHILADGDSIQIVSSVASKIVIRGSGRICG